MLRKNSSLSRQAYPMVFLLCTCGYTSLVCTEYPSACLLTYWRQVYLNDLLSSGNIPDLYTKDEQLSISESLVEVVKAKGISPEPSACWDYFVQQVCNRECFAAALEDQGIIRQTIRAIFEFECLKLCLCYVVFIF